jgi:NTP pyrophosphatase (non-canonical NTP hydrolase)
MNSESSQPADVTLADAAKRATRVRALYHQLEVQYHNTEWSTEEDMLAFSSDIGVLARLVMASEGRWDKDGDVRGELKDKMGECLWWLLVMSDRLDIDITEAFGSFMVGGESNLA